MEIENVERKNSEKKIPRTLIPKRKHMFYFISKVPCVNQYLLRSCSVTTFLESNFVGILLNSAAQ